MNVEESRTSMIMFGEVAESFSTSDIMVGETEVNLIEALLSKSRFIRIMKALITSSGGASIETPEKISEICADFVGTSDAFCHCC